MIPIHLNPDLISRLDEAECAFFSGVARAGNEMLGRDACTVIEKPGVSAFYSPTVADPLFNRMIISTQCKVADVVGILDECMNKGVVPPIEISPGALTHELSKALFARSYSHTEFLPVLVNHAQNLEVSEPKLRIARVENVVEREAFKRLLIAGWTIPPAEFPQSLTSSIDQWIGLDGATCILAYDGDEPISCGILHCFKGIGFLAVSATPPEFRGRGGQSAIDRARVKLAKQAGVELIWSRTYFASVSQRNKEKFGLNVLYMRACWTKL